jgi:hypothetical protein
MSTAVHSTPLELDRDRIQQISCANHNQRMREVDWNRAG